MNGPVDILKIASQRYTTALRSWQLAAALDVIDLFPQTIADLDVARADLGAALDYGDALKRELVS